MGNCLVTKLKASVNNDNLEKLGILTLNFRELTDTSSNRFKFYVSLDGDATENTTASVVQGISKFKDTWDSGVVYDYRTIAPNAAWDGFLTNGNSKVEITNKYYIKGLSFNKSLSAFDFNNYLPKLTSITLVFTPVLGDIDNFVTSQVMDTISFTNLDVSNMKGSIASFIGAKDARVVNYINASEQFTIEEILRNKTLLQSLNVSYDPISGSLASLLDNGALKYPNLKTVYVQETPNLIKAAEDISTLQSLGVLVTVS
jgi:hypothetical protein